MKKNFLKHLVIASFGLVFFLQGALVGQSINPDCTPVEGDIVLNNERISVRFRNGITKTNAKIIVRGTVFFDRNVQLSGCTVKMDAYSQIMIEGGAHLKTSANTVFSGCASMWQTIEVRERCFVDLDDTEFRDATNALTFRAGHAATSTKINNCRFKNNKIGLKVGTPLDIKATVFKPAIFTRNTFQGGVLLDNTRSYCGVAVYNCSEANFLGALGLENKFREMEIGMTVTTNSNVSISYGKFFRMLNRTGGGGYGIYVNAANWLTAKNCSFELDEKDGIYSTSTRGLTIEKCVFKNEVGLGISSKKNSKIANIRIYDNDFYLDSIGQGALYHERSPFGTAPPNSNQVSYNDVKIGIGFVNNKIRMVNINTPYGGSDGFPIKRNHIDCNDPDLTISWGIYVTGSSNWVLATDNVLHYNRGGTPTDFLENIALAFENVNGNFNSILSNIVKSSLLNYGNHFVYCGIHVVDCPNMKICNNDTDSTHRGFHFGKDLDFCSWADNTMRWHSYGIECFSGVSTIKTNLGNQNWHGNIWASSHYSASGATYSDLSPVRFSCRVDPNVPGQVPPSHYPPTWFIQAPTGASTANCGLPVPPEAPQLTGSELGLINGAFEAPASEEWDKERKLLLRMLEEPELMPLGSAARNWYESKANNTTFQFAQIEHLVRGAFQYPASVQNALVGLETQRQQTLADMAVLDSLVYGGDTTLFEQQAGKSALLDSLQTAMVALDSVQQTFSAGILADAQELLSNIEPDKIYEANRRDVLRLHVKLLQGDTLGENEKALLHDIAAQCPVDGGDAVSLAPHCLPFSEAVDYFREGYNAGCAEIRSDVGEATAPRLVVYPNPSNTVLRVVGENPVFAWSIFDFTGRLLKQGSHAAQGEIPVSDLPNGVYLLWVQDAKPGSKMTKFAVLR